MGSRSIVAVDLFAGAGGTSTALAQACGELGMRLKLTAVNHWQTAVETHAANHPDATHVCESLDGADPRKLVPGRLDVLCASPECTHHSNARGGKPCSDQSRATAWHVIRWADALRPSVILVENVREMLSWGPLGSNGRPLKTKKGVVFEAWKNALEAVGYTVSHRLVNAADFGGATTRTRLFVAAVRGRRAVPWPDPTHSKTPRSDMFGTTKKWRAASEILDMSLPGRSVFGRKRPLKETTVRRIAEGIRLFWGVDPEPFLVRLRGTGDRQVLGSSIPTSEPLPTLTGGGQHVGLCLPFVVGTSQPNARGSYVYAPGRPLPTITAADDHAVVTPFLVPTNYGEREGQRPRTHAISSPLPTLVGSGAHAVVSPFLVKYNRTGGPLDPGDPIDTITAIDRFGLVHGQGIGDVLFRMLQPHELAAGMGFPEGYRFRGTRSDVVKQIGNAVEVNIARAHLHELLLSVAG